MATLTVSETELLDIDDVAVAAEAKKALGSEGSVIWTGIEKFLDWLRRPVRDFFTNQIGTLPVIGKWASRIGATVTEFIFTVIKTLFGLLKTVFSTPEVWKKAHEAAMRAWTQNESNGLLAQVYAYGKKMAGYFLEIMKQCFERAVNAHGLQVTTEDKKEIADFLDNLLKSD